MTQVESYLKIIVILVTYMKMQKTKIERFDVADDL
jgi:hypothetical protein